MTDSQGITIFYLEICERNALIPKVCPDPLLRIEECTVKQPPLNRFLYEYIGRQWDWKDRLSFTDQQWHDCICTPQLKTWIAFYSGSIAGYYELVKDSPESVEIRYLGLAPEFIGRGFGGSLLTHAIQSGFAWQANRVWVHTCTQDHPNALTNYTARGMTLYKTEEK